MDAPSPLHFTPADVMAAFSRELSGEACERPPLLRGSVRLRPSPDLGAAIRRTLAAPLSFGRGLLEPSFPKPNDIRSTEMGASTARRDVPLRGFASQGSGERGFLLSHYALPSS